MQEIALNAKFSNSVVAAAGACRLHFGRGLQESKGERAVNRPYDKLTNQSERKNHVVSGL
jgi:hypothetical protein